jgi:alginate O-acetyltransferase complex protein AlgI
MLFNSFHFLIFFIVVTGIYFALEHKYRWFWLLAASCYFYMAFVPVYILILGFTIVVDYFAGIFIENAQGKKRKLYLLASLIANIGVLSVFKYYNFINENLAVLLNGFGWKDPLPVLSILLPIGLSFHTFQAMSYTIEVYRGHQKAERKFGIFALYVMFYPQLVAGPIERPQNLLHQFYEKHSFDYNRIVDGLKLMAWGLFKKVVIADRIAVVADHIYNNPLHHNGSDFIVATVFFSFQIFCDFSGYSDMAIGAAQVMGFKLMTNFDRPYHAESVGEFWKRWHISLSTWFRDYLYISLGGNRVSVPRWYFNLFIVFLVSGLWHGANWTFVIWGALHGCYLVFAIMTKNFRERSMDVTGISKIKWLRKFLNVFTTFVLAAFAWIFFRANNLHDALYISTHLFSGLQKDFNDLVTHHTVHLHLGIKKNDLIIGVLAILLMEIIHILQYKIRLREFVAKQPAFIRWCVYYAVLFTILFYGVFENRQFIYFQF